MDTLRLVPAIRLGERHGDGSWKTERRFWTLSSTATRFGRRSVGRVTASRFLLSTSTLPRTRLCLTQSGSCSENLLTCPTIDASSSFVLSAATSGAARSRYQSKATTRAIAWRKFGYENNYEPEVNFKGYEGVGPFTFEAADYETTLLAAVPLDTEKYRGHIVPWFCRIA
jgi:hypothetical protein